MKAHIWAVWLIGLYAACRLHHVISACNAMQASAREVVWRTPADVPAPGETADQPQERNRAAREDLTSKPVVSEAHAPNNAGPPQGGVRWWHPSAREHALPAPATAGSRRFSRKELMRLRRLYAAPLDRQQQHWIAALFLALTAIAALTAWRTGTITPSTAIFAYPLAVARMLGAMGGYWSRLLDISCIITLARLLYGFGGSTSGELVHNTTPMANH